MNLAHWLERQAKAASDRPALFHGTRQVATYGEFSARARRLAGWLAVRSIGPGDTVAIWMSNHPDYLVALFGIWYTGAAAVPINAKLHPDEARHIIEDSGAVLVFASPDQAGALAGIGPDVVTLPGLAVTGRPLDLPADRTPQDLAWLFYTSGTTGRPKGVMITHGMLATVSLAYLADVDQATGADATLYAAPMSHGAGLYSLVHVLVGARHVVAESGGFVPNEILDLAAHFGHMHLFAAPTMVRRLTATARASGATGEGLRTIVYGGGPMYVADIVEAVETFGPIFVQIYGQGECPMGISALSRRDVAERSHPRWRDRLASVGRAQAPVELRIGNADGAPLLLGETGEIMVRGSVVMPGYWRNPDATAKTLIDGWLMTGDVGFLDADGYLTLQDRSKDLIITGGSNVYPREVEEVLLTHPLVQEVSVVGRPHPDWGEEVVAFVVGEATPQELDRLCIERIARFKRPKAYVAVPELPKNNYGKVLKTDLRKQMAQSAGHLSASPVSSRSD